MASGAASSLLPLGFPLLLLLLLHSASAAYYQKRFNLVTATSVTSQVNLSRPCCYGSQTYDHGDILENFPECCMQLVCDDGEIAKRYINNPDDHGCCLFDDQMYQNGSFLPDVCWKLVCNEGNWHHINEIDDCCAHCMVHNDPHFNTFDNVRYDWHGTCNYSVTQSGDTYDPEVAVYADFKSCWGVPSCLDEVTFKDNPNTVISLSLFTLKVNCKDFLVPPTGVTPIPGHPVLAMRYNGCVVLIGASRIVVMYCHYRLDVWAHPSHTDSLDGLCGHYNVYKPDDFTDRAGNVHPYQYNPFKFPQSWLTNDQTDRECLEPCTEDQEGCMIDTSECQPGKKGSEKNMMLCAQAVGRDEHLLRTCRFDLCMMERNGNQPEVQKSWLRILALNARTTEMLRAMTNGRTPVKGNA